MARRDKSDLDSTISIGALLGFLLERSRLGREETAATILQAAQEHGIWRGSRAKSAEALYREIGRIRNGNAILGTEAAKEWVTVLDYYVESLSDPIQIETVAGPEVPAEKLKVRYTTDIPDSLLSRHRIEIEGNLGLSNYIRKPPGIPVSKRQSDALTGIWRMFRIANASEAYSNIVFFRADNRVGKFERLVIGNGPLSWTSEGFISLNSDIISITSNTAGAVSLSILGRVDGIAAMHN